MTSHGQRGLQLSYNFINLPSVVSGALGAVTYSFSADGTKVAVEDNSGNGYQYMGSLIYAKSGSTLTLESARFAHGYIAPQDGQVYYHTTDHLGSVRAITNIQGSVVERNGYYPFGSETALGSSYPKLLDNRMKFNGKEEQTLGSLGLLDYGARMYDPAIGRWTAQDPLSEKYYSYSAYNYCVNNPVMFVDLDGRDWYSYEQIILDEDNHQFTAVTMYAWTTATSQEEMDAAGIEGSYLGKAVVVFNGYYDEKLGNDGKLTGEGAKPANVIVYGPNGYDDIQNYIGFTMSSDYKRYGAIANGVYDVTFVQSKVDSKIPKTHIVNNGNAVDCLNGVNNYYPNKDAYSATQKNAIYVHRTNIGGFAGYNKKTLNAVSKGCLLINEPDWTRYEQQINGTPYKLIINRK